MTNLAIAVAEPSEIAEPIANNRLRGLFAQSINGTLQLWEDMPLYPQVLQDFIDGKRGPL